MIKHKHLISGAFSISVASEIVIWGRRNDIAFVVADCQKEEMQSFCALSADMVDTFHVKRSDQAPSKYAMYVDDNAESVWISADSS